MLPLPDAVLLLVQQESPAIGDGERATVGHGYLLLGLCMIEDAAKVHHTAGEV